MTLTCAFVGSHEDWEPNSAPLYDRLDALKLAHRAGIWTWASFEPVVDPGASLGLMGCCLPYTDTIKVGMFNHQGSCDWPNPEWRVQVAGIGWRAFALDAIRLLEPSHATYMLKHDLLKAAGFATLGAAIDAAREAK